MSDALTDIDRDQRRADRYRTFARAVCEAMIELHEAGASELPDDAVEKLSNLARQCDAVPRGYWDAPTQLIRKLPDLLIGLLTRRETEWDWLLEACPETLRPQLKVIMPKEA